MWYLKISNSVTQFFLGLKLEKWEYEDNPMQEHIKYKPNCPFIK